MQISISDVEHVAKLARLHLTEDELHAMQKDLGDIIEFADTLNSLDTEGVNPSAHAVAVQNVLREDETKESFDREKLLMNAPMQEDGCYIVPKVVE
ncbi:MAG: Asp-tRNA(Asn)/Glu-tRNA(Gln) amidotransferase subunit GatC [Clostridia bacterium]|nr:Asp-tRNA(Asn)/Glu-tRNA(Gln) amidotransferase subunit GatC [Clostridia bacterium]